MGVKYDRIGFGYNQTRSADPYLTERLLKLLGVSEGGKYLDVGCGTGNYTYKIHSEGYEIIGVDPSAQMLTKAKILYPQISWIQGKAEDILFETNQFDGITAFLTIHHWDDLYKGFLNLNSYLKPNGNLIIFTSTQKQMEGYWLNHYFPQMMKKSILQMPKLSQIISGLERANYEITKKELYNIHHDLKDHFLYVGKHNPNLYLDEIIRNGISSFSDLAIKDEIKSGLKSLEKDILKKTIEKIRKKYHHQNGDYVFIKAKKQNLH